MALNNLMGSAPGRGTVAASLRLSTFVCAIFLSAFLLFSVQPMFAKMVLPRLGGSPSVWSVALVFFQGLLLAGYLYAHLLTRLASLRVATVIHLTLLTVAILAMPIAAAKGWDNPPESWQALWLIGLFFGSVGLPFFAVAGNAPLLQAWFAKSGHSHAADPYFLYSASNAGSFAALILYPILFEPWLTLADQSAAWTCGFVALVVIIGGVAMLTLGADPDRSVTAAAAPKGGALGIRLDWVAIAFVPSALLVAVTAFLTTDIVAVPFLWIVPLTLYLLTFAIAFQRRSIIPHTVALAIVPLIVAPLALSAMPNGPSNSLVGGLLLHLGFFFFAALACHGELALRRPDATHLTSFYLSMSLGGVLGGIFSALVAPAIFSSVLEYPILIVAALLCMPAFRAVTVASMLRDIALAIAVIALLFIPSALGWVPAGAYDGLHLVVTVVGIAAIVLLRKQPALHVAAVVGVMVLATTYHPLLGRTDSYRSFFGVNKVVETLDGRFRLLIHGMTLHGAERIRNDDGTLVIGPPKPTTYYYSGGALADGIDAIRQVRGGLRRVAVAGLGTGSIACERRPGEAWSFYEIDREVAKIATDASKFRFLATCAPDAPIVIGDARLTLAAASGSFDLVILDAFSSDAVPVHLLTREAIAGYFERLAPGGVLLFHISNEYMDLAPIVANAAAADGLIVRVGVSAPDAKGRAAYRLPSLVAAVARSQSDLGRLALDGGHWCAEPPDPTLRTWTDDYSDVLGAILRGRMVAGSRTDGCEPM